MMRRRIRPEADPHRGSATVTFICSVIGMILVVGLVVDGGNQVQAGQSAYAVAESAARAAANSVGDLGGSTGGVPRINAALAQSRGQEFIAAGGGSGHITVLGNQVTATVRVERPTIFLSLIGINAVGNTATVSAELRKG